jgi:outer membrane biosynthesis protein TonB
MGYYPSEQKRGAGAAVVIHLAVYGTVAACFGYALHALFSPTQLANPGVSAYKPPPNTVITYLPARPRDAVPPVMPVAEPEPEPPPAAAMAKATEEAAPKPARAEKRKRTVRAEKPRRTRAAKTRRSPRYDYAYQPFWGGYRWW